MLADTIATLRWLDSVASRHDDAMYRVRVHPKFDSLRSDPRYHEWDVRNALAPSPRSERPLR